MEFNKTEHFLKRGKEFNILVVHGLNANNENEWFLYCILFSSHPLFKKACQGETHNFEMGNAIYPNWHCGCTYYEKQSTYVKIGCDYLHAWDERFWSESKMPPEVDLDAEDLYEFLSKEGEEEKCLWFPVGTVLYDDSYEYDWKIQECLPCDGKEVSRSDYPNLFKAISDEYGKGDGKTTFNLPNLLPQKCSNCPAQWCESNESVSPPQYGCFYGEDYYDEHSREFANGEEGCLKRLKTIERDMKSRRCDYDLS